MGGREITVRVAVALVLLTALVAHVAKAPVKVDALDVLILALLLAAIALSSERLALLSNRVTKVSALGVEVTLEERAALERTAARGPVVEQADDQPEVSARLAPQAQRRIELAVEDCGLSDIDRESTQTLLLRLFERGWVEPDVFRTLEVVISGRSVPPEFDKKFESAAQAALGRLREVAFERAVADRFRRSQYEILPHGVRGSARVDFVARRGERVLEVETKLALRSDGKTLKRAIERLSRADVPAGDRIVLVVPDRSRSLDARSDQTARPASVEVLRLGEIG